MDTTSIRNGQAADLTPAGAPEIDERWVLELEDLSAPLGRGMSLARVSHKLAHGAFELIDAGDQAQAAAFSDLCSGLIEPKSGAVRFLGHDWDTLPPEYANALRGRIGRGFADEGWVPHLSLFDNILLQQRHHTRRAEEAMLADATELARAFGLPGIPVCRPEEASPFDRVRAALVRAFIGDPVLVLLEYPFQGRHADLLEPFVNVIAAARRRGAAVIWLTLTPVTWALPNLPITGRFRLNEAGLLRATQ